MHNVLKATSTSLPQTMPANPTTPLDAARLGKILHGDAQVGDHGVVTVNVLRRGRVVIDDVRVSPEANISTGIEFKPHRLDVAQAWAAPDFSMEAARSSPWWRPCARQGWFVGCLYNQETSEEPQLYFSHMLKQGDAYALAAEIRQGLDQTDAA